MRVRKIETHVAVSSRLHFLNSESSITGQVFVIVNNQFIVMVDGALLRHAMRRAAKRAIDANVFTHVFQVYCYWR